MQKKIFIFLSTSLIATTSLFGMDNSEIGGIEPLKLLPLSPTKTSSTDTQPELLKTPSADASTQTGSENDYPEDTLSYNHSDPERKYEELQVPQSIPGTKSQGHPLKFEQERFLGTTVQNPIGGLFGGFDNISYTTIEGQPFPAVFARDAKRNDRATRESNEMLKEHTYDLLNAVMDRTKKEGFDSGFCTFFYTTEGEAFIKKIELTNTDKLLSSPLTPPDIKNFLEELQETESNNHNETRVPTSTTNYNQRSYSDGTNMKEESTEDPECNESKLNEEKKSAHSTYSYTIQKK